MKNTGRARSYFIVAIALLAALGACTNPAVEGRSVTDGGVEESVYSGTKSNYKEYTLTIHLTKGKAAPEVNNGYVLTMNGLDSHVSTGTVKGVLLGPTDSFTLQPGAAGASTFRVFARDRIIFMIRDAIAYDDGTIEPEPGFFYPAYISPSYPGSANPGGGNGNGGVKTLTSITAVYSSSNPIFPDTTLDTLKEGLTVTATYSDGTSAAVTAYTLSGTLTAGISTVTVSYTEGGVTQTFTFTITVAELDHVHVWVFKEVKTAATCTTPGVDVYECTLGAKGPHPDDQVTAALGHNYQWAVTTPPTLIKEGIETGTCSRDPSHPEEKHAVDSLPITSTAEWTSAFTSLNGATGDDYTLNIGGTFSIAGGVFNTSSGSITVTLKGSGTVSLNSSNSGSITAVYANQTVIIDSEHLILQGRTGNNNAPLLRVWTGGSLVLRNGTIKGNTNPSNTVDNTGGGVGVNGGSFTMMGGTISGNTAVDGGGVFVATNATFTMQGGEISGNTTTGGGGGVNIGTTLYGGGVYIGGTFTMTGGTISGNNAATAGGGVNIQNAGSFTMGGTAKITGNTAGGNGGGVFVAADAALTMQGGEISGNTSGGAVGGGGVYLNATGNINKTSGIIYGNNADSSLSNKLTTATNGYAIWWNSSPTRYRDTTLGAGEGISTTDTTTGWGQ